MHRLWILVSSTVIMSFSLSAATCVNENLTAYENGGSYFNCGEGGGVTIEFNQSLLASYGAVNASVLATNQNSAVAPGNITVNPGNPGLDFDGTFGTSAGLNLAAAQGEAVQFGVQSSLSAPITSTTFSLDDPTVDGGLASLGLIVGQELVCVGGNFTSLPVGLVTSVANGVLGTGEYGCNGTVLVGTAEAEAGVLTAVTDLSSILPAVTASDSATIQLAPYNPTYIDVIKLQLIVSAGLGGSASDTGFGDTFAVGSTAAPEPDSLTMLLIGLACTIFASAKFGRHKTGNEENKANKSYWTVVETE